MMWMGASRARPGEGGPLFSPRPWFFPSIYPFSTSPWWLGLCHSSETRVPFPSGHPLSHGGMGGTWGSNNHSEAWPPLPPQLVKGVPSWP